MPLRQTVARDATHHQRRYHPVAGGILTPQLFRNPTTLAESIDAGRRMTAPPSRPQRSGLGWRRVLLLLAQRGALGGTLGKSL